MHSLILFSPCCTHVRNCVGKSGADGVVELGGGAWGSSKGGNLETGEEEVGIGLVLWGTWAVSFAGGSEEDLLSMGNGLLEVGVTNSLQLVVSRGDEVLNILLMLGEVWVNIFQVELGCTL